MKNQIAREEIADATITLRELYASMYGAERYNVAAFVHLALAALNEAREAVERD